MAVTAVITRMAIVAAMLVNIAVILVNMSKGFVQDFASCVTSHDNHRAERHILQDHRHAFITALLCQELSLIAKCVKRVCWRNRHSYAITQLKVLRNWLFCTRRTQLSKSRESNPTWTLGNQMKT